MHEALLSALSLFLVWMPDASASPVGCEERYRRYFIDSYYAGSVPINLAPFSKAQALLRQAHVGQGDQLALAFKRIKNHCDDVADETILKMILAEDGALSFCPDSDEPGSPGYQVMTAKQARKHVLRELWKSGACKQTWRPFRRR